MDWRERDGVRWLEADLPGARAAFTARLGGVSEGPFESLNVALRTEDEPPRVKENRRRTAGALGLEPARILAERQVHGAELSWHRAEPQPRVFADGVVSPSEADAQATDVPGLAPLVMVADCLPVAVSGPRGVAMAHCGWRGLAAGIAERAASEVEAEAAAIGPGIGRCCYEVGEEVLDRFDHLDGVADGRMLDLAAVAKASLYRAGVEAVESADLCTSCHPELFFSHRRDGPRTGRQAGLVWLDGA
jgi:YfiH family protein